MTALVISEEYQKWKKTDDFIEILAESKRMRPDVEEYLLEQLIFAYFMTEVLNVPLKESSMKKPEPNDLIKVCGEVFENEEAWKVKYGDLKEVQPLNVKEGEKPFEVLEVREVIETQPLIVDENLP